MLGHSKLKGCHLKKEKKTRLKKYVDFSVVWYHQIDTTNSIIIDIRVDSILVGTGRLVLGCMTINGVMNKVGFLQTSRFHYLPSSYCFLSRNAIPIKDNIKTVRELANLSTLTRRVLKVDNEVFSRVASLHHQDYSNIFSQFCSLLIWVSVSCTGREHNIENKKRKVVVTYRRRVIE